jgi:hypothetical protein
MPMGQASYPKVVELVRSLSPAEQWRLRDLLEVWLAPPGPPPTEDEFEQELLRAGVVSHIPPPITDLTQYENRKLIQIEGKPLSETIIEERR